MKRILAIGGAVIKTAKQELIQAIKQGKIEMLIHNGGSIFHDFQQEIDCSLQGHSYPLDNLVNNYACNKPASDLVWNWVKGGSAPKNTVTNECFMRGIDVLLFTGLACDFWQLFGMSNDWSTLAEQTWFDYKHLVNRFKTPFHYLCMGSAVIHPEVFIKAVAEAKAKVFTADVVDFKDMYRPKTRISKYGTYYKMTHKEYFDKWQDDLVITIN